MTRDGLTERIRDLVAEGRDRDFSAELTDDTPLYGAGLGLHSLEVLALVLRLEEAFDVSLDAAEVGRERLTLGTLARLLGRKLAEETADRRAS